MVEWNGIKLRGRSEEEVREVIDNNTFYELELVVKRFANKISLYNTIKYKHEY